MAKLRILLRALENTVFLGKELIHLDRVDSTNTYLKELLNSDKRPNEGLLVFAEDQFAGKGQLGATWLSEPGENIAVSILFSPTFLEPKQIFYFNKAIALAVRDCVEYFMGKQPEQKIKVSIKWPNDILVGDRKVAGVLIENIFRANTIENSIVGIGINVNQEFIKEKTLFAISLKELISANIDISDTLLILCAKLEKYYFLLRGYNFKEIDGLYHKHLFGLGEDKNFIVNGTTFKGVIKGVGEDGLLDIEVDGGIRAFEVKQIEFVK